MRVKSLTPPLPSVLPMTATTSSAVNCPALIRFSRPLASCTDLSSTFATSIAIVISSTHPRRAFPAQHFLVAFAAVDHRQWRRALRAQGRPLPGRGVVVDIDAVGIFAVGEHDAIDVAC